MCRDKYICIFWMTLCLPNYCIRAPLRHTSPIILPDMVYQKLNYSLLIACFSLLGSCETHKMPALYALTQHQYSHKHTALTSQHSSESHFITNQMSCRRLCTSSTRALYLTAWLRAFLALQTCGYSQAKCTEGWVFHLPKVFCGKHRHKFQCSDFALVGLSGFFFPE